MSLASCVSEALKANRISKERADELLSSDLPEEQVIAGALEDSALKKRQTALQILAIRKSIKNMTGHEKGASAGLMSLITRDITGKAGYDNIEYRGNVILAGYHAKLADMLESYRTKNAGFSQDKEGLRKMVRELFEESTGDADAAKFAKAWAEVAEEARIRFNRVGGAIRKKKGWRLPQGHDPLMVGKASADEWASYVITKIEPLTDDAGRILPDDQAMEVLKKMHETIKTEGLNNLEIGKPNISGKTANRHREARVLDFKDADSWLEYQDRFGSKDIFTIFNDHLRSISNDTAAMEILGPNPSNAFNYLIDTAKKSGVGAVKITLARDTMRETTGVGSIETSVKVANAGAATRSGISSALLGGAFLSSVTDTVSNAITARYNGLPAFKVMNRMIKQLNPASKEDRLLAVKIGLGADAWLNRSLGANRYLESMGKGVMGKLSDITMRTSLLAPWTSAGRNAFGLEFSSFMADSLRKGFDELPKNFKRSLTRYGISKSDWAKLQKIKPLKHEGVEYLGQDSIMAAKHLSETEKSDLLHKYMGMIQQETSIAVPTPDARVRAMATFGTQKGTLVGEVLRSLVMFKSFPITMVTTHLYRAAMTDGIAGKSAYMAQLLIGGTLMGALAMQMKDIAKGKEPRPMDNAKFWAAAMAQSGGLGIFGDFLFSDQNRFGGGFGTTITGPVVGLTEDALKLTVGNVQEALQDKDTNIGSEAIQFVDRYKPVLSQWYVKLALERMVFNQLEMMADPKVKKKYNRMMRKDRKEHRRDYWWKKGELLPE